MNWQARRTAKWCTAVFLACFASSAWAVVINFNGLGTGTNTNTLASNMAIQNYMNGILSATPGAGTVVVTGARSETAYTGDGHVVGPANAAGVVTPLTLGDTDGGTQHGLPWDSYIVNQDSFDRITMVFSRPVSHVSFDLEIFPDGTCPNVGATGCASNTSANWPDFELWAGTPSGTNAVFTQLGLDPNSMTYHSSTASSNERAPQLLGVSGDRQLAAGVTELEFRDWPARVGIDNLNITFVTPPRPLVPVPEPGTLALLSLGFAGLWLRRRPVL